MDYLDIARAIAAGHWSAVANGYWGTLYSVLLSPLFLFRFSPAFELPLVHLFGLLILLVTFLCFRIFLHTCLDTLHPATAPAYDNARTPIPDAALSVLGYTLFLWSALIIVPVKEVGPDALVSAVTYLASAVLLRLKPGGRVLNFAAFGALLGIGYWCKAVMFPVGIIFLGISMLRVHQWRRNLLSVVAFAFVAAPLLAALSLPRGRFTFGDSGGLAYATIVSPGGRDINWQGDPPGSGIPKHTTRQLTTRPAIFEFNGPIGGTYPPSYDPSYWNEGHRSTFNLRAQMATVAGHVPGLIELLIIAQPGLIVVFLFLMFWDPAGLQYALAEWWPLLAVSSAVIGLYMLVHLEGRFIGACVVLIWFSLFCAVRVPRDDKSRRLASLALLGTAIAMMLSFASYTAKSWMNGCPDSAQIHLDVAQHLNLPEGTPVAIIGAGNFSYWAHLARVRIVAEIMPMDEADFWRMPDPEREPYFAAFRSAGAQWLIAQPPATLTRLLADAWQPIATTSYYRYSLARPAEARTSAAHRRSQDTGIPR
jgi:hypothetical protein